MHTWNTFEQVDLLLMCFVFFDTLLSNPEIHAQGEESGTDIDKNCIYLLGKFKLPEKRSQLPFSPICGCGVDWGTQLFFEYFPVGISVKNI